VDIDIDETTLKRLLIASQLDISNLSLIMKSRVELPAEEKLILEDIAKRNVEVANILGLNDESLIKDIEKSE
jgi:hypothetical protein